MSARLMTPAHLENSSSFTRNGVNSKDSSVTEHSYLTNRKLIQPYMECESPYVDFDQPYFDIAPPIPPRRMNLRRGMGFSTRPQESKVPKLFARRDKKRHCNGNRPMSNAMKPHDRMLNYRPAHVNPHSVGLIYTWATDVAVCSRENKS